MRAVTSVLLAFSAVDAFVGELFENRKTSCPTVSTYSRSISNIAYHWNSNIAFDTLLSYCFCVLCSCPTILSSIGSITDERSGHTSHITLMKNTMYLLFLFSLGSFFVFVVCSSLLILTSSVSPCLGFPFIFSRSFLVTWVVNAVFGGREFCSSGLSDAWFDFRQRDGVFDRTIEVAARRGVFDRSFGMLNEWRRWISTSMN